MKTRIFLVAMFLAFGVEVVGAQPALEASGRAELQVERVRPSQADPDVKDFDDPDLVVSPRPVEGQPPLAVFLPGTGGRPENVQALLRVMAAQGYRVIGLQYDDEPSVVQVCPRQLDPDCSERFRKERVFGGDEADPPVKNPAAETIVRRLVMLLRYLDRQHPSDHWAGYLDGDEPVWSKIVISGLSQGAGMAAYIAKQRAVERVVLFSSPWDFYGANRTLAPWLAKPSATPPARWFAEFHRRENTAPLIARAYRMLEIPAEHILVFDLDLPGRGAGSNPFHGSTVRLVEYTAQWRVLFGEPARN